MRFAIENEHGQWWAGTCWSVEQSREEYDSIDDLPFEINADNLSDNLITYAPYQDAPCRSFDIRYNAYDIDTEAVVRII